MTHTNSKNKRQMLSIESLPLLTRDAISRGGLGLLLHISKSVTLRELVIELWNILRDMKKRFTLEVSRFFGTDGDIKCVFKSDGEYDYLRLFRSIIPEYGTTLLEEATKPSCQVSVLYQGVVVNFELRLFKRECNQLVLEFISMRDTSNITASMFVTQAMKAQLSRVLDYDKVKLDGRMVYPNKYGFVLDLPPEMMYGRDTIKEQMDDFENSMQRVLHMVHSPFIETRTVCKRDLRLTLERVTPGLSYKIPGEIVEFVVNDFKAESTPIYMYSDLELLGLMLEVDPHIVDVPSFSFTEILDKLSDLNMYQDCATDVIIKLTKIQGVLDTRILKHPYFSRMGLGWGGNYNTRIIIWNLNNVLHGE